MPEQDLTVYSRKQLENLGFNLAVLLTNLKEHIIGDNRLQKILNTAKNMLDYFDKYLGRIEIMGSSKRVEKVYFEIKDEWLEQFNKPQIKASKKDFLFNVMQDGEGDQGKLEAFVNFCEDTIFEVLGALASNLAHFINDCSSTISSSLHGLSHSLKPSQINERKRIIAKKLQTMTTMQIIGHCFKIAFQTVKFSAKCVFTLISIIWWFLFYSMFGSKDEDEDRIRALPVPMGHSMSHQASTEKPTFYMYSSELNPGQFACFLNVFIVALG
uniref:Uncharacterized protein n=1 Tax=Romanomermis culicivorax TaxID=13658 RepID=A0A915IKY4_ROMCU